MISEETKIEINRRALRKHIEDMDEIAWGILKKIIEVKELISDARYRLQILEEEREKEDGQ